MCYWKSWFKFLKRELLGHHFLSPQDFHLFKIVKSADEAVKEVLGFYKVYNSIRYVKGQLVIRLNKELADKQIDKLNKKFSDILVNGKITKSKALPEECEDKDCPDLSRIVMHFNRHDFGKLTEMVNMINTF